jgi:uncharacterized delta-60 repeat protein
LKYFWRLTLKARGIFTSLLNIAICALIFLCGCGSSGSDPVPQPKSSQKSITAYSLNGVSGTINETEKTIALTMPYGTNVTALAATFTTTGQSVNVGSTEQVSGTTANTFTNQVTYTVTAADATMQDYTVIVTVASASAKAITAFSLGGVSGTINETDKTITVIVPYGSSVTGMKATFTTTGQSVKVGSTEQISGSTYNNFTSPVTYTVTAADSSTQDYTVTVTVALSSAKAITSFSLNGSVGTINEAGKTIAVSMPYGTYVMDLVATFTTTGTSVKVGSDVQVSGTTAHNFTSPVTYTVTAGDSSTQNYTVTVTVALSPAKAITAFSLNGVAGTINEAAKTIALTLPASTNANSLVATFTTTGASVEVGSTIQASGTSANNFTSPVTYKVTAANATTQNYTVTVIIAPSGSLDASFGTGGKVKTAIGTGTDIAYSVAIQSNGKIVVAGYLNINGDLDYNSDFALVRYNSDGSLDTAFGTGGKVTTAIGTGNDYAYSVAIQPDGKIVMAGSSIVSWINDFALARYNTDGSLDTSFDTDGKVTTNIGTSDDFAHSVAIQSNGKIVAAGLSYNGSNFDFALARYNTDGSLDAAFGTGGKVTTAIGTSNSGAWSVAIQSDGRIVAAGYSYNGSKYHFTLARYNSDGSLDTDFGTGGMVTTPFGTNSDIAMSVAIQSDGKIVAAGSSSSGSNLDFALVRYTTSGLLDTDFGTGGMVTTAIGTSNDWANSIAIQPDGKIVAAGYSANGTNLDFALVRYNSDGSLDIEFGTGGKLTTAIGTGEDGAAGVAIQSDGKIVAAGCSVNSSNYSDFVLVRYWP